MKIKNITIVGLGTQGSMIAFRAAANNKRVYGFDLSKEQASKALEKFKNWINIYKDKYNIDDEKAEEIFNNIIITDNLERALESSDIVIENVPEVLDLKQKVWGEIDEKAPEKTLLTTNSSSIKSSMINKNVKRKVKTFNINFSTPVKDDLVEIMWNNYTSKETKKLALDFLKSLGHIPIVTKKEIKGFSANRLWRVMKKECLKLWANGYSDPEDIDRAFMLEWGTEEGPFGVMDMVGLDVVWDIEMSYYQESNDLDDMPPQALKDMIDRGMLGEKSGKGFYEYPNPAFLEPKWLTKGRELNEL